MAIDTILVAVGPGDMDRVERLAEEAVEVAKPTGARVVVAHVFTQDEYDDTLEKLDFQRERSDVTPDEVASRHAPVRDMVEVLEAEDVPYDIRGDVGNRAEAVIRIARATGADLIYVGGRKRSPAGKAVFGSVAQEIMLDAPCPVTFVRGDTS